MKNPVYTTVGGDDNKNHPVYPGSRLALLVDALDDLAAEAPSHYTQQVSIVHDMLRDVLVGDLEPPTLIWLLDKAGQIPQPK